MLNASLANVPIYFMSLYKMPVSVCSEHEKLQRKFLWGGCGEKRGIHLASWKAITMEKVWRLAVQSLKLKNDALLAKWWWRYGSEKHALWRKVIVNKFEVKSQ